MLDLTIDKNRCIQCGQCADECPLSLLDMSAGLPRILRHKESHCIQCQHCLAICPTAALSILGVNPDCSQPLLPPDPDMVENLMKGRRTVRRYRPEAVDAALITRLMDVTAYAPTGKNERAVLFTLIDNPETMALLRTKTYTGIQRAVQAGTLPKRMEFFGKMLGPYEQGQDIIYRHAPHMLMASAPINSATPEADPFIALSYCELMAQSLGLGSTWCGFARWAVQIVVPELSQAMGIPADHHSMYALLFGYPAVRYTRTVQRQVRNAHRVSGDDLAGV